MMKTPRSIGAAVATCALALAPSTPSYAQQGVSGELNELRQQNRELRSEMSELRAMIDKLAKSGVRAAPPPAVRPPWKPPAAATGRPAGSLAERVLARQRAPATPAPTAAQAEEERRLAAEFAAELGGQTSQSVAGMGSSPRPAPRPRYDASASTWMGGQTRSATQTGRRNFWGVGGVPGQTNTIDFGLVSEFIAGFSNRRNAERGGGANPPNGLQENELTDHLNLRETELAIGGYVDPYHRADALLVWNAVEDEVELEEGFMTFFNLPEGFRARVGKFRSRTGRINGLHAADLPWVTLPKVNAALLGEEGFAQAGARLTYIGKPMGRFSWSLDLEIFNGDSETLVDPTGLVSDPTGAGAVPYDGEAFRDELIQSMHLQNHIQLTDTQDLEIGYSRLQANNDRAKLQGVDVTWRDLRQPGRNEWKLQFEGMRTDRDELAGSGNSDRGGYYLWADRRFDRNNAVGVRFDKVEDFNPGGANNLKSRSVYWTHFPTEFSWYRLQYQEDEDTATGLTDKQVYLQFRWQIGVDRHALQ